jgi:hypothetical protein
MSHALLLLSSEVDVELVVEASHRRGRKRLRRGPPPGIMEERIPTGQRSAGSPQTANGSAVVGVSTHTALMCRLDLPLPGQSQRSVASGKLSVFSLGPKGAP